MLRWLSRERVRVAQAWFAILYLYIMNELFGMFEGINIIAVLGTSCFMLASATVWYSPLLFGKRWLSELGVTEAEIEASRQNVYVHLTLMGLGYAVALTGLATLLRLVSTLPISAFELGVGASVIVAALVGTTVLWENRSRWYFFITAGYYTYFIVVGILLLSYWPW